MYVRKGDLYKAKKPYSEPQYNHFIVWQTGDFDVVHCWVCDAAGDIDPRYNQATVLVSPADAFAEFIGGIEDIAEPQLRMVVE